MIEYQHWHLEKDLDKIFWLTLNRKDASVNSISVSVLDELDQLITQLIQTPPSAVIIISGKEKGFIAGADIKEILELKTEEEAYQFARHAQKIFARLEHLPVPTVAMIQGFCLGGGLELALACQYRVADVNNSFLGLPEVNLGLHPGWGGTVRLPQLIGPRHALELMLNGKPISGQKAKKLGLVDAAVPDYHLRKWATHLALKKPKPKKMRLKNYIYKLSWTRKLLGHWFLQNLQTNVEKTFYPASCAIINNWVKYGARGSKL